MKVRTYIIQHPHEAGADINVLSLPRNSEILCFKVGKKTPYILVLQEDDPKGFEERKFIIAMNDQDILCNDYRKPEKFEIVKHYGTDFDSGTVLHLFEVKLDLRY